MADVSNIRISPEQMSTKANEFDARCEEFQQVVGTMRNMVSSLCDEWAGRSSQAFYDQFASLEPGFKSTAELITSIAQQLRDVSTSMQNIDQEIAGKIGTM